MQKANVTHCLYCGHFEAFCPSHSLILDLLPDEKISVFGWCRHNFPG
ncbi:MAG: hypothetical protein PHH67_08930 [Methanosarcina sp.]|nr:hypothetical protein [Methanosarcina sp.]